MPKLQDPRAQGLHERRTTRCKRIYIKDNAHWLTHFAPLPDGLKAASLARVAQVLIAAVPCVFQRTQNAEAQAKYQKLHGVGRVRGPVSFRTDEYRCASATSSSSLRNATTCWRRRVGAEHHGPRCTLARNDETVSDCRCCGQVMLLATRPRQRQEEQ